MSKQRFYDIFGFFLASRSRGFAVWPTANSGWNKMRKPKYCPVPAGRYSLMAVLAFVILFSLQQLQLRLGSSRKSLPPKVQLFKSCLTRCCRQKEVVIEQLTHVGIVTQGMDPCRSSYGFINGAWFFRFARPHNSTCRELFTKDIATPECYGTYSHDNRIANCRRGGQCTSPTALCLMQTCELGMRKAYVASQVGVPPNMNGSMYLRKFMTAQAKSIVRSFIMSGAPETHVNTIMTKGYAVQQDWLKLSHTNSTVLLSSLHYAASMFCGLAALAAIPFYLDLAPFASPPSVRSRPSRRKLIALTYCNKGTSGLYNLIESAEVHNVPLVIVGWGDPAPTKASKLGASLKFLKEIDEDTVVMFMDAYDTVLTADPKTILSRFDQLGRQVVFGGEGACFPFMYESADFGMNFCSRYYPKSSSTSTKYSRRYVNSGQWIAYADSMALLLGDYVRMVGDDMVETFPGTDQAAINMMVMSKAWDIGIDHNGTIFQVALDYADNSEFGSACLVHFNAQHARGLNWSRSFLPIACSNREESFSSHFFRTPFDLRLFAA